MKPFNTRILLAALLGSVVSSTASADRLSYEQDVRPVLKAHCFQCHGEDGEKQGGLDLRLRRFVVGGGDSGPAVVPGNPDGSLLYSRVSSGEMPPEDKQLAAGEIAAIRQWIQQGAIAERDEPKTLDEGTYFTRKEREFWAFQPIKKLPLPAVESNQSLTSPIDHFVHARLKREDLEFSPLASKRTLIRRLYFDLLGIPAGPDEVDAFLADDSPNADQRLVDRLLASPRYGERWGRHWLDVAGYADSEGYVDSDPVRNWAYLYRDYVIRAFNNDKPFDQFVVEQMAGDELVPPTHTNLSPDQIGKLTATGFLRMAPDGTAAGGIDQNVARNEVIADTINIMTTSLLGLTVGCARCHDHRYDPISQQDYYRLCAIFEPALDWKSWRVPNARKVSLYTDDDRKIAAGIEAQAKAAEMERQEIIDSHIQRTLSEELIKAPDDLKETLRTAYQTPRGERTKQQVALLKEYPNIQNISSGSLYLYSEQRGRRADEIAAVAKEQEQAFIEKVREEQLATLSTDQQHAVQRTLAIEPGKRSEEQTRLLAGLPGVTVAGETLEAFDPEGAALVAEYRLAAEVCRKTDAKKQLADLQQAIDDVRAKIPKEHFIRALTEPPNHTPATFLFKRGNHDQPGEAVAPGELEILTNAVPRDIPHNDDALATSGRRLAYARHLTSGDHPLLARVLVNRVWFHHFGRGIVNTPGDFGQLGERPSHPDLLDWLAREFIDSGWQVKRLHRLILSSRTYQQASTRTEQLDAIDPDNTLYARQSIRRIESESFRDAVLTVSGLYGNRMFGPPIPVMEDDVGQIIIGQEDLDGERKPRSSAGFNGQEHRRSIYIQVRRSRPLAVLETFDIATVAPNCVKRPSSNVAPQSLLLMNSDFMVLYAEAFSDRLEHEAGQDLAAQLQHAWSIAYAEQAPRQTITSMSEFVERQAKVFQQDNGQLDEAAARRQALAVVCQALMGANRFIYVD